MLLQKTKMIGKRQTTVYTDFAADFMTDSLADLCDSDAGVQTGPFGSQLHQKDYVAIGTPIITVEHLGENRIQHEDVPCVSDADRKRLAKYKLRKGDVVFSRVGSVDRRALVREKEDGWLFSGRCLRVRPDQARIDAAYLSYFFGLPAFKEHIRSIAVGATMPSLNTYLLSTVPIYYPPLPEQKAIASILGSLDDKIELNRQMNHTLETMAQAIFKSWFVDFDPVNAKAEGRKLYGMTDEVAALFPAHFEEGRPAGWGDSTIGEEFNVTMGQSPPGETYNEQGNGLPFYQGRTDFGFRFPGRRVYCTAPTRIAEPGDTLVSVRAPVGDINMTLDRCAIGRGVAAVRHTTGSSSYTYYAMKNLGDEFSVFEGEGTLFGSIGKDSFHCIRYGGPSSKIVKAFENIARPLDDRIANNERESQTLTKTRDALLPKLLSGEIRVKHAEKLLEQVI